jgi:hypothetical protein
MRFMVIPWVVIPAILRIFCSVLLSPGRLLFCVSPCVREFTENPPPGTLALHQFASVDSVLRAVADSAQSHARVVHINLDMIRRADRHSQGQQSDIVQLKQIPVLTRLVSPVSLDKIRNVPT